MNDIVCSMINKADGDGEFKGRVSVKVGEKDNHAVF